MRRTLVPELLDDPGQPSDRVRHSLGQVSQANRWLGGDRGIRDALASLVAGEGGQTSSLGPTGAAPDRNDALRILDVGVGDGSTLERALEWTRGRVEVQAVGVDLNPLACSISRERLNGGTEGFVVGSALHLPFPDRSFDCVLATLTLHHFDDGTAPAVLAEMVRVCRGLVIVSELERSLAHYLGAQVLAHTVWGNNRITRHDAPASVRAGFTRPELLELAHTQGLRTPRVRWSLPFRVTLSGWVPHPQDGPR